jgi:hypothetical protein
VKMLLPTQQVMTTMLPSSLVVLAPVLFEYCCCDDHYYYGGRRWRRMPTVSTTRTLRRVDREMPWKFKPVTFVYYCVCCSFWPTADEDWLPIADAADVSLDGCCHSAA